MLIGLKVSSLVCKCVFYRREHNAKERRTLRNWILKVLKYKNEIYQQQIELKEYMKKMEPFV